MGFNNGSILIVEDDPLMSDLLTLYLRQEDYKCISVSSSEDAWTILSDQQYIFDCILLDINLPGISGIDLLKKIKADSALFNLPVIMETADDSNESILEGMNNGAYYYLTKPVAQEKLIALLKVAVGDFRRNAYLKKEVKSISSIFKNCQDGRFYLKPYWIASALPLPWPICSLIPSE